ncbi:hypothetical protein ACTQV0_07040 [Selenomonas montiformis]|uniref:hypothetical protein n=1 Tax=Selenomonas montiformis TaxID=2652285 RepID=UPI003F959D4F
MLQPAPDRGILDSEFRDGRIQERRRIAVIQLEKIKAALEAVEACCGHCAVCSPSCPIAVSRRALAGLRDDLLDAAPDDDGTVKQEV